MRKYIAAAAVLLTLVPACLAAQDPAQDRGWSLTANPRFGYFFADKPLGSLGENGRIIEIPAAATTGLALELGTPLRFLSVRGIAETTIGAGMAQRTFDGTTSCGVNCTKFQHRSDPIAEAGSVLNLALGLRVSPAPATWLFRPYAVGGVGLKRYDLGRGDYDAESGYTMGGRAAGVALNGGLGLDARLGKATLNFEAVNYMSGITGPSREGTTRLSEKAIGDLHHDLFVSVGLKVDLFGKR